MTSKLLDKILRYFIYSAAFVPLVIFSDFISPFHFGKVVILRSMIEIMAVFYLILIAKDRRYRPNLKHPLVIIFGLFTLFFGISTIVSVNPYLSFWGSLERMGGFWSFLHYLVYFLILTSVLKKREDWFRLLKVMVFVGALSAFYGFGQRTNISWFVGSGGRQRIFGTIGNPALFAGYQIINLFIALMLAFSSWVSKKEKTWLLLAGLINTIAILMTVVRGSIVGIVIGFLVFTFLFAFEFNSKKAKKVLGVFGALLLLFVAFSFLFKNSPLVKGSGFLSRVTDFSLQSYTVQTRFWAWQDGLTGWKENPKTVLLGWGPENFNVPFSKYFNPKFFRGTGSETLFDRAHNMFVEVLVTMGLVALLVYVAIFVFAYRLIWRYSFKEKKIDRSIAIGLISLITAYIIHNFFIFDTSSNFLAFFTVFGFITVMTQKEPVPEGTEKNSSSVRLGIGSQTVLFILLIGAGFLIYNTNILQSKANYATTRAIVQGWQKDFNGAIAKYKEALLYDVPGKYDYRHNYAQYVLETLSSRKIGDKERAVIEDAVKEVQKNADEVHSDYLPYLYLSRLYIVLGKDNPLSKDNDTALMYSMKALSISPNFVRTYYEVAQAYLNKKDINTAIKYFSKAAELNPDVGLTYWYLAAAYFEKNDVQHGLLAVDNARRAGYDFSEQDLLRLVDFYLKQNDFQKISLAYQDLIKLKPNNPQYHASLAVSYAKIGRIDDAIAQARMAVEVDPSFEKEARAFMQSLGRSF